VEGAGEGVKLLFLQLESLRLNVDVGWFCAAVHRL
jgi:hypothetical protein